MSEMSAGYEVVEHTADWAIRVYATDLGQLMFQAALGMAGLLVPDLGRVPTGVERKVEIDSLDAETLLVDWLSELAYWAEDEMLVITQVVIEKVSPTCLQAVVRGGRVTELNKHIKAVTFHDLEITETAGGLEVTIVFDV